MSDIIRAELSKSDTCTAEGFTVRANAPVLGLCRKLVDAGYDPDRPLHCYRGDTLCLKIRSIGEGAKLTVREDNRRGLRLVPWMPFLGAGVGQGLRKTTKRCRRPPNERNAPWDAPLHHSCLFDVEYYKLRGRRLRADGLRFQPPTDEGKNMTTIQHLEPNRRSRSNGRPRTATCRPQC
jgi:hypothetical protein